MLMILISIGVHKICL